MRVVSRWCKRQDIGQVFPRSERELACGCSTGCAHPSRLTACSGSRRDSRRLLPEAGQLQFFRGKTRDLSGARSGSLRSRGKGANIGHGYAAPGVGETVTADTVDTLAFSPALVVAFAGRGAPLACNDVRTGRCDQHVDVRDSCGGARQVTLFGSIVMIGYEAVA